MSTPDELPTSDAGELALLLTQAQSGDCAAADRLLQLVYDDLRRLAQSHMSRERHGGAGMTLQATALVHEAYLRMLQGRQIAWSDRRHFFIAAAVAMRRILVERARRLAGPKAGGGRIRQPITDSLAASDPNVEEPDWEALDQAMADLSKSDPELAEIVHLRYFAGLSVDAAALALDISARTVDRRWQVARAWLLEWTARHAAASRLLD